MSFKQKFYYVCGQICSKCVGKFCEKCTSRLSFSIAHLPPSPCYYLPQVFYSLYFFRIKILESCPCHPSSLALNPPVPVYHTFTTTTTTSSSTTSVPVNIYYTTTTTTTHSSTTSSVHAPSPFLLQNQKKKEIFLSRFRAEDLTAKSVVGSSNIILRKT